MTLVTLSDYKNLQQDPLLTNYGLSWRQGRFIADEICQPVQAPRAAGKYPILGKEYFRHIDTRRAARTRFAEYEGSVDKGDYDTKPYGLLTYIEDRERENNDFPIALDQQKTREMRDVLDLDKEYRVFALATAAGSFATDHTETLDDLTAWDNFESSQSDPEEVIGDAKDKIWADSLQVADTIVIPYPVASKLARHPKIKALREKVGDKFLTSSGLPPTILDLRVVVPSSGANTAERGQTESLSPIWGDTVIVCKTGGGAGQFGDPQWLASFRWRQFSVFRGRIDLTQTDVIILSEQDKDEKLISNLLAFKISNTLAA